MESNAQHHGGVVGSLDPRPDKTSLRRSLLTAGREADFLCNYCRRKFFNGYALGGHQNAHKRERDLDKRRQVLVAPTSSCPPAPPAIQIHYWLHAGGDLRAAAVAPVLADRAWASEWDNWEGAAAPEVMVDLSLKL